MSEPDGTVFTSPWEMLETIFAEHGDGGIEIWRDEDGVAQLATAVADVLVKLGPPA